MKLTARQVETAKPKDKPYKLADGGGLYLLVNPNGKRYWRLKYRSLGKEKLLAIGVYPDVSLAEARNKREDAKRTLAAGNDPSLERKIEKLSRQQDAENSFEAITREWYQRRYDRWSVSYREEMMRTFEKDVFPYMILPTTVDISCPHYEACSKASGLTPPRWGQSSQRFGSV